jgi:diguanylate cyclase (GGDEF)-like protein
VNPVDQSGKSQVALLEEPLVALDRDYLTAVLAQVQVPMIVTDLYGHVLMANDAWSAFHPVPPPDMALQEWLSQFRFFDRSGLSPLPFEQSPLFRVLEGETVKNYEYSVLSKDGELRFRSASGQQLLNTQGATIGAVLALHDITSQRRLQDELERRSLTDSLTGLANRALLVDRLHQALGRSERDGGTVTVLLCDLDRFKWVNDAFGHPLGDRLLVEVGNRIKGAIRLTDTVARLGGDEFVVVTEEVSSAAEIEMFAQLIRAAVAEELLIDGAIFHPSLSIGVASTANANSSAETLLRDADTAMYQVKAGGGGSSMAFDDTMRSDALRRVEVRNQIERAIDSGAFKLLYQPIVDGASERLVGVEALIRIVGGSFDVGPDEFIPAAEEAGLIEQIDCWVLAEATQQLKRWLDAYPNRVFTVACNVSARTLASDVWTAQALRAAHELGPTRLKLELTETAMIRAGTNALTNIASLRKAGLAIGLDDFGTGYASLTHLRSMPISFVKIDRSFVSGLHANDGDRTIVLAIVQMAKALGLTVVAEGVELVAEAQVLQSMGCEYLQGYLFGRPLEAERICEMLSADHLVDLAL